jgi:hypothetical protein
MDQEHSSSISRQAGCSNYCSNISHLKSPGTLPETPFGLALIAANLAAIKSLYFFKFTPHPIFFHLVYIVLLHALYTSYPMAFGDRHM